LTVAENAYKRAVRKVLGPAAQREGVNRATSALGFWLAWRLYGGFDGLRELGMARRTIYFQLKVFQLAYGKHPDEFELPGVVLDPDAYMREALAERATIAEKKRRRG
jgi:hypothetical protein